MSVIQKIEEIIAPSLNDKGYEIVRIQISGNIRRTLQIMIEKKDEQSITIGDCTNVSRLVSVLLDVEDVIEGSYNLEVSSAGLDRPLVKVKDFIRYVNSKIAVKTLTLINNQKNFEGILETVTETMITLLVNSPKAEQSFKVEIPFEKIRSAHLQVDF